MALTISNAGTGPSKADWDAIRPTFTQLYLDFGWKLKDIVAYMSSNFSFVASESMFKKRVRMWGLDKKCKEAEMRALIRLARQRRAFGKASVATVRGRRVHLATAVEYFRRKKINLHSAEFDDLLHEQNSHFRPIDVRCSTPAPDDTEPSEVLRSPKELPDSEILRSVLQHLDIIITLEIDHLPSCKRLQPPTGHLLYAAYSTLNESRTNDIHLWEGISQFLPRLVYQTGAMYVMVFLHAVALTFHQEWQHRILWYMIHYASQLAASSLSQTHPVNIMLDRLCRSGVNVSEVSRSAMSLVKAKNIDWKLRDYGIEDGRPSASEFWSECIERGAGG